MSIKESSAYLKALSDLSVWDSPPEGLVFPVEENTAAKVQKLIKQNNFIISLLIRQSEKLDRLEQKAKEPIQAPSTDIEELVNKLSNLTLAPEKKVPARKEAPFYVFKDPKLIWKEERAKFDGAKN